MVPAHTIIFGDAFDKGLLLAMGQSNVQKHMPKLLEHIAHGALNVVVIGSLHRPLSQAVRWYEMFKKQREDCRKVVLTPDGTRPNSPLM